jgi:hypothetical protein
MVYPHATSEAGARRPAIIQLEQFKEASSKPAQLKGFSGDIKNYFEIRNVPSWEISGFFSSGY